MIKHRYSDLAARVDALRWARWRRAKAAALAAGTGDVGVKHNALVSAANGKPWREVDYSQARLAGRLYHSQFEGYRVLENTWCGAWVRSLQLELTLSGRAPGAPVI